MRQYLLKISSKNEKSLDNFLSFFFNCLKTKFDIVQKLMTTHNGRKVFTLLKSPHVNKIAQEQFEARTFTKHLLIKSFYLEKNFIFLKKILNKLFKDVSINLEFITSKNANFENNLWIFYPDNFELPIDRTHRSNSKRSKQKHRSKTVGLRTNFLFNLRKFLSTISIFGEILAVDCLDSF